MQSGHEVIQLDLALARKAASDGIAKVAAKNATFIETMRGVARLFCHRKGTVTADDLREWAAEHHMEPTHYNAYGAIFRSNEFECVGRTISKQVQGHGNEIKVWKLRYGEAA